MTTTPDEPLDDADITSSDTPVAGVTGNAGVDGDGTDSTDGDATDGGGSDGDGTDGAGA